MDLFSNEKQVTEKTPPMFLTHAVDDTAVPSTNSKTLFDALQAAKIPSKYLELPSGGHGLNGYQGPMWDAWQKQSLEWLVEQGLIRVIDVRGIDACRSRIRQNSGRFHFETSHQNSDEFCYDWRLQRLSFSAAGFNGVCYLDSRMTLVALRFRGIR